MGVYFWGKTVTLSRVKVLLCCILILKVSCKFRVILVFYFLLSLSLTPTTRSHWYLVFCKLLAHRCFSAHVFQTASQATAGQCWRVHIWIPQCQWHHCDEGAKLVLWTCVDSFLDYSDRGFAQFYQCRYNQTFFCGIDLVEKFCKEIKNYVNKKWI